MRQADIQAVLDGVSSETRKLVMALRNVVRACVPRAEESLLWGGLSYHRPEVGGRVKGAICQIVFKNDQVRLDFIHGIQLSDPSGILQGQRVSKRYMPMETAADTRRPEVAALIREAAVLDLTRSEPTAVAAKPKQTNTPTEQAVAAELGAAQETWNAIIGALSQTYGMLDQVWKPSKGSFGWMCLLQHRKKTLLYMTPENAMILIAVVLGERAVANALVSDLPEDIKVLISEARPFAEGRGVRFPVSVVEDVPVVLHLVAIKTAPK